MSRLLMVPSEVLCGLGEQVATAVARARRTGCPVLVSRTFRILPRPDVTELLARTRAGGDETFWWERGSDRFQLAGFGRAWCATASGAGRFAEIDVAHASLVRDALIRGDAADGAGPVFFGAFAFAPTIATGGPWQGFAAARLALPRLLLRQHGQNATATLSGMADANGDLAGQFAADLAWLGELDAAGRGARAPSLSLTGNPSIVSMLPREEEWRRCVARAIADIAGSRLEKLVLARCCRARAAAEIDCAATVRSLRVAYPSCATFWVGLAEGDFLGATPELLARLDGRAVSTSAVAGSAARGASSGEDEALGAALLASAKDRHEHEIVLRAIEACLRPLCGPLRVPNQPRLLLLENVQHLLTPISGQLREEHRLLQLIDRLHPTPAVAGYPRAEALRRLADRESIDRGWYAGPIGWIDAAGNGEFAVALRSALVRGADALLYAGAGIVAGSDPDKELAETRLKLRPLLHALTAPRWRKCESDERARDIVTPTVPVDRVRTA